ncbi:MAG: hypothetical protein ABFD64_02375 [Armatimonadota bacterium]
MRIRLRFFITAVVTGVMLTGICYGQDSLQEKIGSLHLKKNCSENEIEEYKAKLHELLDEYKTPQEEAIIYDRLIRCWMRYDSKKKGKEKEYLEYCKKYFACKAEISPDISPDIYYDDMRDKCGIYWKMSDILYRMDSLTTPTGSGCTDAAGRKSAVVPLLQELKMLLDNNIPDSKELLEPIPYDEIWNEVFKGISRSDYNRFSMFAIPSEFEGEPGKYEKIKEADRIYRERINVCILGLYSREYLVRNKKWAIYDIEDYYTRKPYNTEELQKLATDILKDKAVVSGIVAEVKKHIANGTTPQSDLD